MYYKNVHKSKTKIQIFIYFGLFFIRRLNFYKFNWCVCLYKIYNNKDIYSSRLKGNLRNVTLNELRTFDVNFMMKKEKSIIFTSTFTNYCKLSFLIVK